MAEEKAEKSDWQKEFAMISASRDVKERFDIFLEVYEIKLKATTGKDVLNVSNKEFITFLLDTVAEKYPEMEKIYQTRMKEIKMIKPLDV